jgi:iron complex transport system substrate-binding protein
MLRVAVLVLLVTGTARADPRAEDSLGRKVSLEAPARRIVALAPHIVENTFSAGAGGQLVGVVSYSNYPPEARDIQRVGDYQAWSLESVVALRPDLVLMWSSGNGIGGYESLERLGIPVFVSEPRELEDVPRMIRAIGALAGTEQVSEPEAQRIEQGLARLRATYAEKRDLSVFYQVWNEPLQTVNGEHMISRVIETCGGYNVFADTASLAPTVSLESVLRRDPDVIVASGMDAARPEWLDMWTGYPYLKAVRNEALLFVHPDHIQRPTARLLLGAERLCDQMDELRK